MADIPSDPHETIAFRGRIGEIIHTTQPDGRVFERYRRPPGTRIIIISPDNKILVTKEHRHESAGIDLRLPGGKVRDSVQDYHDLLASGQDITDAAREAAIKEVAEETGFKVQNLQLITKANAGATVEWDLYYFMTRDFKALKNGQQLEHGEDIQVGWMTPAEIRGAITRGQMQEWRSAGVLLGAVLPELKESQN